MVHQSAQSSYPQSFPRTLKNRDLEEKDIEKNIESEHIPGV